MSLTTYRKKRNFRKTSEPSGTHRKVSRDTDENRNRKRARAPRRSAGRASNLVFVVQKHAARRLHYDVRIELDGALVSWAVPRGPSMNPGDRRLAVKVEDHPFDYKDFEGVIPEGNYGAGSVIVWDQGVYMPVGGSESKKENESIVRRELKAGDLKIVLLGKKLKGQFAIVKIRSRDENAWLMIKKNDEYASASDVLRRSRSVVSRKRIEDVRES